MLPVVQSFTHTSLTDSSLLPLDTLLLFSPTSLILTPLLPHSLPHAFTHIEDDGLVGHLPQVSAHCARADGHQCDEADELIVDIWNVTNITAKLQH